MAKAKAKAKGKYYGNRTTNVLHGRAKNDACRVGELKAGNVSHFADIPTAVKLGYRLCRIEWKNAAERAGLEKG